MEDTQFYVYVDSKQSRRCAADVPFQGANLTLKATSPKKHGRCRCDARVTISKGVAILGRRRLRKISLEFKMSEIH